MFANILESEMATEKIDLTSAVRSQADRPQREKRVPFGITRTKLEVPMTLEGYHLHWVNDEPGRVMEAQRGGYTFVDPKEVGSTDTGSQVKRLVGKSEDGSALYAYLMKIEQSFYEEDQAVIQREVDKFDSAIRRGTLEQQAGDNRYNDIKITKS
jgi:hypothetical protein